MTMTNLAPTSLFAILPSGETFDFVRPGISRVVGRTRGVLEPEFCLIGRSLGLLGAVPSGVSLRAPVLVAPTADAVRFVGGGRKGWISGVWEPFLLAELPKLVLRLDFKSLCVFSSMLRRCLSCTLLIITDFAMLLCWLWRRWKGRVDVVVEEAARISAGSQMSGMLRKRGSRISHGL